jgi:hypothetical protein
LSDLEDCQGETPRPESPASRAGVSAIEDATAALRGDPLHHFSILSLLNATDKIAVDKADEEMSIPYSCLA